MANPPDEETLFFADQGAFASDADLVAGLFALAGNDPESYQPPPELNTKSDPSSDTSLASRRFYVSAGHQDDQFTLKSKLLAHRLRIRLTNSIFNHATKISHLLDQP